MSTNARVMYREGTSADAEGVGAVHHAAVHHAGAEAYPPDALEHWSGPLTGARLKEWSARLSDANEYFTVAVTEGVVVAFGSLLLETDRLRGTYVKPDHARAGIGSELLAHLEENAVTNGLDHLQVDASINARAFYAHHGYEVIEETTHRLEDGYEIACIRMRKALPSGA